MKEKSKTPTELMFEAPNTISQYHYQITRDMDKLYGQGWSKEHPEAIATLVKAAAIDYATNFIVKVMDENTDALKLIARAITEQSE